MCYGEDMIRLLDQLEALLAKATPRPWAFAQVECGPTMIGYVTDTDTEEPLSGPFIADDGVVEEHVAEIHSGDYTDTALIVAAVNALPDLLASARALEHLVQWADDERGDEFGTGEWVEARSILALLSTKGEQA